MVTLGREARPDLEGPYVMLSLSPESAGNSGRFKARKWHGCICILEWSPCLEGGQWIHSRHFGQRSKSQIPSPTLFFVPNRFCPLDVLASLHSLLQNESPPFRTLFSASGPFGFCLVLALEALAAGFLLSHSSCLLHSHCYNCHCFHNTVFPPHTPQVQGWH